MKQSSKYLVSPLLHTIFFTCRLNLIFVFSCVACSPRRLSLKEPPQPDDKDDDLDRMLGDFQRQRAAKALQRQWRGYQGRKRQARQEDEDRQNQAALTLQKNWRRHRDWVSLFSYD